jgi:hypothetical protein
MPKKAKKQHEPRIVVTARGGTPAKINKPSVGMDDEISVIYPSVESYPPAPITDAVTRREFCARLDGFPDVERVRTERALRVVSLLEADMLEQWLRTRPGGWNGTFDKRLLNELGSDGTD